jgi:multidrug resistance efflux pump
VAGAIVIMILGFTWFGWMLGSTADKLANQRADTAVVAALTPICVEKFQHQAGAAEKLAEFKKISSSWDRRSAIEKGGWATSPGSETANSAVASACAEKLGSQT